MAEPRRLLELLAAGELRSGEALAEILGISRAAVWKLVARTRDRYGIPIEALPGKGYRLPRPLELLDPDLIRGGLGAEALPALAGLHLREQIPSTNSWLMQRIQDLPSGSVCLAEQQTAGRGRHGRTWVSPFGHNLYLSLLWHFPLPPAELGGLSLAAGVGVALALSDAGVTDIGLKWPNDLLWQGRKLAGLLIEVAGETQGPTTVVCGVGVNTFLHPEQARPIEQPWTDLSNLLGEGAWSRNALAALVLDRLLWVMRTYEREGLAPFLPEWRRLDPFLGRSIELRLGDQRFRGTYAGIDDSGALRLAQGGGLTRFLAGEASLRPEV